MENNNIKEATSCIPLGTPCTTMMNALSLSSVPPLKKKLEERDLGVEEREAEEDKGRDGEEEKEREGRRAPLVESAPLVTVLGEKIMNDNKISVPAISPGSEKKSADAGSGDGLSDARKKGTPPLAPRRRKKMVEESLIKRLTPPNPVKLPAMGLGLATERYMSPTDSLMSPVSKGLLARNRRSMRPLPAYYVPPKVLDNTFVEADAETSTEE